MAYSQKYTIVQFLEPVQDRQVFPMDEWPLHVSLADVFAIELTESLIGGLSTFLGTQDNILVRAAEETTLGEGENAIRVTLLNNTPALKSLHAKLIDLLEAHGAVFNSPEFTRGGFLAHSTHQKHAQLKTGQQVSVNELALVDMFVDGDWRQRKVLQKFKLKLAGPQNT